MSRTVTTLALAASFFSIVAASAQEKIKADIKKLTVDATKTPQVEPGSGVKLIRDKPRDWLQIDVEFQVDSRSREDFINSMEIRFFVLPKSAKPDFKKLFTCTISHVDILKSTDLHSAVYFSPNALQRMYGSSGSANPRDLWVAVEIHAGGKMVGWDATDGKSAKAKWWRRTDVPTDSSTLRPKHKTPYALFWYDSYAEVRE